jgi:ATP/maltotriose-dependent transcriptional regulator MalT
MPTKSEVALPESLIATKFIPTEFDPRLVSRRTLFDGLLGRGSGSSVLSIVATAGSGKSTLMAELRRVLADRGAKTCWISLDSDDDSPAAFAAYFVCALCSAEPTLAENELALLRGNQVQDFGELFDQLVSRISNISSDFAIFLDDFQHITNNQVLSFVNRLATHLPPSVRLVIASRSCLQLELSRLRVSGLLTEIEQDALNFDSSKASEFLRRIHGLELSQSDLDALMATTEGWPTGLQLAALALHRYHGPARELIDTFSGHDKDLTSYLVESVLRSQPKNVSDFLLMTAPLRRMSADLCQAVSGYADSNEMLVHIERCNLFLISLDRQGQWYRYHHLFAEFLQIELRRTAPETYQIICDKAAQWCERNGHTTEAIQYALDGGYHERASDLIAEHALELSQRSGDHFTILDWMRRLPEAYQERRPEILLSHAWSRAFSRDSYQALELANRVLVRLRHDARDGWDLTDEARNRWRLVAQVTQAVAEATSDRLDNCIVRSNELRAKIPENEPFLIAAVSNCLSYCYFAKREFEKSTTAAADAYLYGHRSGAEYATGWADFLHGLADLELGRLRTAQEHSRRMENNARGVAHRYLAGLYALLSAEIATQRCEFEIASTFAEGGSFFADSFGPLEPLLLAIRNQARRHAWANNIESARHVLMQGQDLALTLDQPRLFLLLAIEEVVLRLNTGDVAGAIETAQRTRLQDKKAVVHKLDVARAVRGDLQILEARLLIANDKAPAALRILNLLQHTLTPGKCGNIGLTVRAVKAIALWRCERPTEAIRELDHALTSAAPEFHAYPIFSAGPELLPVLRAIHEHRSGNSGLGDMEARSRLEHCLISLLSGEQSAYEAVHPSAIDADQPWESLTKRESRLLRLVEAGLANKQLAKELFISEATVKWHLHNIYGKIGVRSRTAAIARARELMLI